MAAYYNEFDEKAAAWLRELIRRGLIAPGDVDTRSIVDVRPDDLAGYTQCHFFAGIGVWSYALRRAGWPDDRPVWTGSPPCQPFSAAGKGLGFDDERHLWPAFFHLIDVRRPDVLFGEQVASKDGLAWLDHVHLDMEGAGYAFGAKDLCAAGFGAPHIRQRQFLCGTRGVADPSRGDQWTRLRDPGSAGQRGHLAPDSGRLDGLLANNGVTLGDAEREGLEGHAGHGDDEGGRSLATGPTAETSQLGGLAVADDAFWWANLSRGHDSVGDHAGGSQDAGDVGAGGGSCGLADNHGAGQRSHAIGELRDAEHHTEPCSGTRRLGDANAARLQERVGVRSRPYERQLAGSLVVSGDSSRPGPTNGHWGDADWLLCRDGKWRPVEPGTFPLAHGAAARVGRLRGYGNAIVAQVAEGFIASYLEAEADAFDLAGVGARGVTDAAPDDWRELLG